MSSNYTLNYINKLLEKAKTVDKAENEKFVKSEDKGCLPKELINHEERIKRIKTAEKRIDREPKQKPDKHVIKIRKYKTSYTKN